MGAPLAQGQADRWRLAAAAIAAGGVLAAVAWVMAPWWRDTSTFGFHDWDVQTSHRQLVLLALRHGELPAWNPYACGGFPAWGYVEAATTVVSPWLPAYLLLPMSVALRVEVTGMALLGAAGAWLLAGRFTASFAARALVAALWAVNGRWALQTASGHTWHLAYAFLPWCLFFFERLRRGRTPRAFDLAGGAVAVAMLVYAGGIYPLPHTVLVLGLYATGLAALERGHRPLSRLAMMGGLGAALSAPKLLPLLDGFSKAPRLIESSETLSFTALWAMLTSREQAFYDRPARVMAYGWHEWGIYVSVAGVVVILAGLLLARGRREAVLKVIGVTLAVLAFGAFHPAAPWTLLHRYVPIFKSQHVPSRFLYPAVLVLGVVAASLLGRAILRERRRFPWLDAAAALLVAALAIDVASVAEKPMAGAMWMAPPPIPEGRTFHFEKEPPFHYKKRDWAGPMYLAMLGNTGVLNCYGTPPFERKGALAVRDPRYRGEVELRGGAGSAELAGWTPGSASVTLRDVEAGALLVYNMNFDEGWQATVQVGDERQAAEVRDEQSRVAVPLPAGATRVELRYRPPRLAAGLLLALLAVAAVGGLCWRERAARRPA